MGWCCGHEWGEGRRTKDGTDGGSGWTDGGGVVVVDGRRKGIVAVQRKRGGRSDGRDYGMPKEGG